MNSSTSAPLSVSGSVALWPETNPLGRLKRVVWALAAGWCLVTGFILYWNYEVEREQVLELARTEARASYEKDLVYRRWATMHGGVYVPPTATTPPNPYLSHLPDRDVMTTAGKALTLVNPAYMTRQVFELAQGEFGVRGHITSLDPIRPENGPDPWEKEALLAFARGVPEMSEVSAIGTVEFLRLMRPMRTEPGCLKCHGDQGYKVGDIRGGISVSVPLAPYWQTMRLHIWQSTILFSGIGLLGLVGLGLGYRLLAKEIRARTQAEQAVQESARQFRSLVEQAIFPVVVTSFATGRILFSNRRVSELLELGSAPVTGRVAADFWVQAESRRAFVDQLRTEREVVQNLVAIRTERGRQLWVELSASRIEFQGEDAALSILNDVTARRQIEAERRTLMRAVEQSPVTVVITDPNGAIEYANPQFAKSTGYTLEEVRGQNPRVLKSGQQGPEVYRELWTAISAGREWHGELCNRRKDGALYWEDVSISPVHDETGKIVNYLAVKEDITARREAIGRMREQAALLNCTGDAILVVDLDGIVQFWNRGAEGIYGWLAEEAVGRSLFSLVYDEERPPPVNVRRAIIAVGEWSGELTQRTKAGVTVMARARGVLLRHPDGTPRSLLLTASDITEAKRLESQYLRAQRLESIGALASGVAHDLNNVLSPILMSIELLRPLAITADDREVLRLMNDSARRGADIVRQLLLFGRGAEGPSEAIEVGRVLHELLQMMRETFPRNIAIGTEVAEKLWAVRCFGTQVYQILLNLTVNARDAMPSGGRLTLLARNVTVDQAFVRLHPEARLGRFVELGVIDTGTGIPVEIQERIFDPFFTTKAQGKGTGLGLCTVMGILTGQGGFLTVSSKLGEGSAFRVFLPAVAQGQTVEETAEGGAIRGRGETVLLIEDEASIRHVVARTLLDHGFKVLVASNGDEGVTTARSHAGDLRVAIVDMMMPGVQGPDLVRELRRLVPALPIVVCSGLDRYRDELVAEGFESLAFLPKPFVVAQLWEALRKVLS